MLIFTIETHLECSFAVYMPQMIKLVHGNSKKKWFFCWFREGVRDPQILTPPPLYFENIYIVFGCEPGCEMSTCAKNVSVNIMIDIGDIISMVRVYITHFSTHITRYPLTIPRNTMGGMVFKAGMWKCYFFSVFECFWVFLGGNSEFFIILYVYTMFLMF